MVVFMVCAPEAVGGGKDPCAPHTFESRRSFRAVVEAEEQGEMHFAALVENPEATVIPRPPAMTWRRPDSDLYGSLVEFTLTNSQVGAALQNIAQLGAGTGIPRSLGLMLDRTLAGGQLPNRFEPIHYENINCVEFFNK
jgi:hypothetical protein